MRRLSLSPPSPSSLDLLAALDGGQQLEQHAFPAGAVQAVSLSTPKPDATTLLVHPLGTLTVKENVVPLDLAITKYGNATPSDGSLFSISDVQINGNEESRQNVRDYFAAGQFLTLSDADKLSRPSFELYDSGVQIGSPAIQAGADSPRNVVYREFTIPSASPSASPFSTFNRLYSMPAAIHSALVRQGAGFMSQVKKTGLAKYRPAPGPTPVVTTDPVYVVAAVSDLTVRSDIASAGGGTYYATRGALDTHLALHPEDAGNLQILPLHEAAA